MASLVGGDAGAPWSGEMTNEGMQKLSSLLAEARAGRLPAVHAAVKEAGYSDWIVTSRAEVAALFGCHVRCVDEWSRSGMPGKKARYDLREIAQWYFERHKGRAASTDEEVQEAKKRKIIADAKTAELTAAAKERSMVSRREAEDTFSKLGSMLAEQLQGMPDRIPSLSAAQRAEVRTAVAGFLSSFRSDGERVIDDQFQPG